MKKIMVLFIAIILLFSTIGHTFDEIVTVGDLIKTCPTIEQLGAWIYNNITYVADERDYWQSPEKTLKLREGDCEDYAILFREGAKELGINATLAGMIYLNNKLEISAHGFCFVEYDKYNDTCIGFFDTVGLTMFDCRRSVKTIISEKTDDTWTKIYIFKKKKNPYFGKGSGWWRIKTIRRSK